MSNFEVIIELPCKKNQLFDLTIKYENYKEFFPNQIKKIEMIKDSANLKITKEILVFKTILEKEIVQETEHIIKKPEYIESRIISGPLKNSKIKIKFEDTLDFGTLITINGELKTNFKYKIITPIIKKYYKSISRSLFYKMNGILMNT